MLPYSTNFAKTKNKTSVSEDFFQTMRNRNIRVDLADHQANRDGDDRRGGDRRGPRDDDGEDRTLGDWRRKTDRPAFGIV